MNIIELAEKAGADRSIDVSGDMFIFTTDELYKLKYLIVDDLFENLNEIS